MPARSRPTIREVAAHAGVSHQTISRVINGSERVSPETRQKVEAAIAELGYSPNAIARLLAQGRPRTFACIAPNLTDYTFASIIEGAEVEARKHDYFVITASAPNETVFETLLAQLVDSRRTEGLLVINPFADQRHKLLPQSVPTVFLGARPRSEAVASVSLNDEDAGFMATQHLLQLGHRQIAVVTGPLVEDCSQDRLDGFDRALETAGLEAQPGLVVEGDWSATSGHTAIQQLLQQKIPFSAIFAQNDRMAVGAIQALREAGRRVPDDVSVIGFDDMPLASYFDPPLTTLQQDMFAMGREAVSLLIQAVEQPGAPVQNVRKRAALVVRGSTGPLKS